VLFAAACAITPFIVLNQQVITGRSLQPFHFEQFILSYLVLVGIVILDTLWWKHLTRYPLLWIALPLVVGVSLALKTTKVNSAQNHAIDAAIPLLRTLDSEIKQNAISGSVLFDRTIYAASAPTYTSSLQTLWSPYTYTYGSVTDEEDNERLYQSFYYLGVDEKRFASLLEGRIYRAALFGLHRVNKTLVQNFEPITADEIQTQVSEYAQYVQTFSQTQAQRCPLSRVVLTADRNYNLSNLDRWYERDGGQRLGDSIIYRVRLKSLTGLQQ
jgi:hypothetical protein